MTTGSSPRTVSYLLGTRPKIGPFPTELFVPWLLISIVLLMVAQCFSLRWIWTVMLIGWGDVTWWIITGSTPWRFLARFVTSPHWTKGYAHYHPLQQSQNSAHSHLKLRRDQARHRAHIRQKSSVHLRRT